MKVSCSNPSPLHFAGGDQAGSLSCGGWGGPLEECLGDITRLSMATMVAAAQRARQAAPLQEIAPIPYRPVRLRSKVRGS